LNYRGYRSLSGRGAGPDDRVIGINTGVNFLDIWPCCETYGDTSRHETESDRPCDETLNALRNQWATEGDPAKGATIGQQTQERSAEIVPLISIFPPPCTN